MILTMLMWHHLALTFWIPSKEAELDKKNIQQAIDSEMGNKDLRARQVLEGQTSISIRVFLMQKC